MSTRIALLGALSGAVLLAPEGCSSDPSTATSGDPRPDASVDGGSSGDADGASTGDGSIGGQDAMPDADAGCEPGGACSLPCTAPPAQCEANGTPISCTGAQHCCVDDGTACTTSACTGRKMECLSEASCAGGEVCCAEVGNILSIGCPATISGFVGSVCATSCPQTQLVLCFASDACEPGQKCDPAILQVDYGNDGSSRSIKVGVCK